MGLRSLSKDSIRINLLRIYDIRCPENLKIIKEPILEHIIKYENPKHFQFTEYITVTNII